jgi:DNA-binding transcriptional ArsR family regulator
MEGVHVLVQPGTGYELLLSAINVADRTARGRLDDATLWRKRIEAVDGGALRADFEKIGREPFINLLGFVHAQTEEPSVTNALAAFADAPARDVVLALVGYHRRAMRLVTPTAVMRDAIDGDPDAIREFRRTSMPDLRYWQATLRHVLGRPADEVRAELVDVMTRWYRGGFAELEPAIARAQAADAVRVGELVSTLELDAVLERVSPGINFARELGQSRVVLVPDTVVRPSSVISDHGSTILIGYPVETDTGDPRVPPDRLIRLANALADPIRLRAMRELASGPTTVTELAERLGVPRTSLTHHVRILTYAGLVTLSVDDATWGQLELRDHAVGDLVDLTERYVRGRSRGRASG